MIEIESPKIALLTQKDKWIAPDFQSALQELSQSIDAQIFFYEQKEDLAVHLSQLKKKKFDRALICGGDGSLHYAVEENLKIDASLRIPLGIIPLGTANDFARSAGFLKEDLPRAVREAAFAEVIRIDVGWVNQTPFINVVTGGDVAKITTEIPGAAKSLFGKFAYYLNSFLQLPSLQSHKMAFHGSNWSISDDCFAFAVGNNSSAGGGMKVAPEAQLDDGLLDLLIVPNLSLMEMTALATELSKESPDLSSHRVHYRKTSQFQIQAEEEIQINIDGEPSFGKSFEFKVLPQTLEMAVSNRSLIQTDS